MAGYSQTGFNPRIKPYQNEFNQSIIQADSVDCCIDALYKLTIEVNNMCLEIKCGDILFDKVYNNKGWLE